MHLRCSFFRKLVQTLMCSVSVRVDVQKYIKLLSIPDTKSNRAAA